MLVSFAPLCLFSRAEFAAEHGDSRPPLACRAIESSVAMKSYQICVRRCLGQLHIDQHAIAVRRTLLENRSKPSSCASGGAYDRRSRYDPTEPRLKPES